MISSPLLLSRRRRLNLFSGEALSPLSPPLPPPLVVFVVVLLKVFLSKNNDDCVFIPKEEEEEEEEEGCILSQQHCFCVLRIALNK